MADHPEQDPDLSTAEKKMIWLQVQTRELEANKMIFEWNKHITTLSTGSIVILAIFLDKIFRQPMCVSLLTGAFILLICSIILSLLVMLFFVVKVRKKPRGDASDIFFRIFVINIISFVIAMIFVAAFAVRNLPI